MHKTTRTKKWLNTGRLLFTAMSACLLVPACNAGQKQELGVVDAQLTACPSSPNCVSSDSRDPAHQVPPFSFTGPPEEAWQLLLDQVARLPRTNIVKQEPGYLHVECRSRMLGFIDDMEFHLRPERGVIAVRSAARTGYYDFGVNRDRVEKLRSILLKEGIAR